MRKKKVWRYWCDHCDKGGCHSGHMARHEERCFANPDRKCPLCESAGEVQEPIGELMDLLLEEGVEAVQDKANGCPACTTAAIVQVNRDHPHRDFDFDYKKAYLDWKPDPTCHP